MRLLLAALALAFATPALAQQTLAEQVAAARQMYMGGLATQPFRDGGYYRQLIVGLDGSYVELSGMLDAADAAGIRRQQDSLCKTNPFVVTATPPFGFFITRGSTEKIQYTYTGGVTFVPAIDVIGFAQGNPAALGSTATDLLKRISEPVAIFRPSRDVFVISGRDVPDVFVRCGVASVQTPQPAAPQPTLPQPLDLSLPQTPAAATAGEAPAAEAAPASGLEIALGKVFERQFGTGRPEVQAEFVACAAAVFAPMSADDLKTVMESGFAPTPEVLQRLEAAYPGLSASLQVCGATADRAMQ